MPPTKLSIDDLEADLVADFLTHVETARGNTERTRNKRLVDLSRFISASRSRSGCIPFELCG